MVAKINRGASLYGAVIYNQHAFNKLVTTGETVFIKATNENQAKIFAAYGILFKLAGGNNVLING